MPDAPKICFIDAASRYGVAIGRAGTKPQSWTGRFAKHGASQAAISFGAMKMITAVINKHQPDSIVIEMPLAVSLVNGRTTLSTTEILMGLPFVIQGMAYGLRVYDVSVARVSKIRTHFIGSNPKGDIGKERVWRKCLDLGWISALDDDLSNDRTDALAGWSYAEHQIAPKIATPVDDLFVASEKRKRDAAARSRHHAMESA
jgi:hypothetical protein